MRIDKRYIMDRRAYVFVGTKEERCTTITWRIPYIQDTDWVSWVFSVSSGILGTDDISWYTQCILFWSRRPAQYSGHWLVGTFAWGPVWFMRETFHDKDCRHGRSSDVVTSADHTREESDLQRHQARQLSGRTAKFEICKSSLCRRLWNGKAVSGSQDETTYSIPRT